MTAPDCSHLASKIRQILGRRVTLDPAALHFIDSTYFNPGAEQLHAVLKSEGQSGSDSLLELLLSPDETLQCELEEILGAQALREDEEEKVAGFLDRPPATMIWEFPDGRGVLEVELTAPMIRRFLSHLKLTWRPHPDLAAALDAVGTIAERARLRVRLRNCRVDWSQGKAAFMSALLKTAGLEESRDLGWIDFALEFLVDTREGEDISQALDHRKCLLVKALHQACRQKELLEKANVESLMSCGVRFTYVDEAATHLQLAYIDRISLAVYGRIHQVPWADALEFNRDDAFDVLKRFV